MAGTGKSTIALTVAHRFSDEVPLNASFFFSRGGGDLDHAGKFFSTLAFQLANKSLVFKRHLCEAIKENPTVMDQALCHQWTLLLLGPLSKLQTVQRVVLVIDALDECEKDNDIQMIIEALAQTAKLNTITFRVFITSRPEVRSGFDHIPVTQYLHRIPTAIVQNDIFVFLLEELRAIGRRHNLSTEWPEDDRISRLSEKAGGLFIFASTACNFIRAGKNPEYRLSLILHTDASSVGRPETKELDRMYTTVLQKSFLGIEDDEDQMSEIVDFKVVVGAIILLFDTLSHGTG
jgi:hypothetical protein